jgi:Family of unknown function (DUF6282)
MEVVMLDARQLMEGAVDTHVHSAPDLVERKLDDFDVARQARERGMAAVVLKKVVLTHPDLPVISLPVDLQRRLAERGVFFERTYNIVNPPYSPLSMPELAARIRAVGPESTVLAADFGQTHNPMPAEGLEAYIRGLLDNGFTAAEVRPMVGEHARALLDV